MSPRLLTVAGAFVVAAVALIAYKVGVLGYEISPQPAPDRWSVQTEVRLTAPEERTRLTFLLPADGGGQRIYDERVSADGMRFYIRPKDGNRVGVAVGRPDGPGRLVYRFSVQTRKSDGPRAVLPASAPALGDEERKEFTSLLGPEEAIQTDGATVSELLEELSVRRDDRAVALQQIHDFIVKDVETTNGHDGPQDALAVLQRERGGAHGKARAEVALLRAAGIPARVVVGVPLVDKKDPSVEHWVEARLGEKWWPLDPVRGSIGFLPEERLVLHVGDAPTFEASYVEAVDYRVSMLREAQTQYQIYERRVANSDRLIDKLSLFALPVKTQELYRVLLLVPLGALVVALFRNVVGVPTFGTFMPILISLAFRESGVGLGVALLGLVVAIGFGGRWALNRAQLLMVPRLSFLLTLVILIIAGVMVVAQHMGFNDAYTIALFPIVIVTMTIERLSIAIVEEGPRNATKLVLGTLVVSTCGYWVIASEALQAFVFTFPEVHLVTLAVLLLLGRYTGYRLSEWTRFRAFRKGGLEKAI
ncbi:UUP1 family membrane protein [Vulgatibacter sp.]|uniref:UUP1 family membrane protein n=1 Tax=Vulgatibacter sp. TaxID=1971226 RepID=UPI00356A0C72